MLFRHALFFCPSSVEYFNISTDDALQLVRYMASTVPTYVREYGLWHRPTCPRGTSSARWKHCSWDSPKWNRSQQNPPRSG